MKITVISDTHIEDIYEEQIPQQLLKDLKSSDLILHAGDLTELNVFESLMKINKTYAVWGNMDSKQVLAKLPKQQILQLGRFKVGLVHGQGPPEALIDYVRGQFDKRIDCIVFGHSHYPVNEFIDGILYFNPGSPTDKIFSPYNSYGILEINDKLKGRIIKI